MVHTSKIFQEKAAHSGQDWVHTQARKQAGSSRALRVKLCKFHCKNVLQGHLRTPSKSCLFPVPTLGVGGGGEKNRYQRLCCTCSLLSNFSHLDTPSPPGILQQPTAPKPQKWVLGGGANTTPPPPPPLSGTVPGCCLSLNVSQPCGLFL